MRFEECSADLYGGAVTASSPTNTLKVKITSSTFKNNKAGRQGGALRFDKKVEATLFGALNVFEGNKAEQEKETKINKPDNIPL